MTVPALPVTPALARRLCGRPLVLLLDVDGTLSPIAPRPEYAIVPPETRELLRELAALPYARIVIVSGRGALDARRLVGVDELWVIGNHGLESAPPGGAAEANALVEPFAARVSEAAARCRAAAHIDPGIIVEDKRWTVSVHYRLAHPRFVADLTAQVSAIAAELGLRVTKGKEVLEIRPPVAIDKGTAARELVSTLGGFQERASLLCAGDDRTDEDAFRVLRDVCPGAVTVHVGTGASVLETIAEFCVADTAAMAELLRAVLTLSRDGAIPSAG